MCSLQCQSDCFLILDYDFYFFYFSCMIRNDIHKQERIEPTEEIFFKCKPTSPKQYLAQQTAAVL